MAQRNSGAWRAYPVDAAAAGLRLDAFLAAALGVSRAGARRALLLGGVRVDGRPAPLAAKGRALCSGQRVEVQAQAAAPPRALRPLPAPELPLCLLAEGPGWLAVDKPAGTPVHPLLPGERGALLNALVARRPEVFGVGEGGLRSGVVHRLDVQTSGVLLFATNAVRWRELRGAFRSRRIAKWYRALVHGRMEGAGELALHLHVAQHRPARVRVAPAGAPRSRLCTLRWRALTPLRGATLLEVRPRSGFLHQVRASLAHIGHPLLGDTAYGAPPTPGISRHMLHAARIAWRNIQAESPTPPDFTAAQNALAQMG
ncbi:MAG: RluA family pseudouridine synthase [Deltaproteobacteria bacterium]|nr:RluA family pseudouridine synthase [Deltaproteobacteria bacterium]